MKFVLQFFPTWPLPRLLRSLLAMSSTTRGGRENPRESGSIIYHTMTYSSKFVRFRELVVQSRRERVPLTRRSRVRLGTRYTRAAAGTLAGDAPQGAAKLDRKGLDSITTV